MPLSFNKLRGEVESKTTIRRRVVLLDRPILRSWHRAKSFFVINAMLLICILRALQAIIRMLRQQLQPPILFADCIIWQQEQTPDDSSLRIKLQSWERPGYKVELNP
jgi:hypothetical protein